MQRWLAAKLAKQKRLRRAYLKRYPSQGVDAEKARAYELFQNSARVRTLDRDMLPLSNRQLEGKTVAEQLQKEITDWARQQQRRNGSDKKIPKGGFDNLPMFKNTFTSSIPPTKTEISVTVWANNPRTGVSYSKHLISQSDKRQTLTKMTKGPLVKEYNGIKTYLYFSGGTYCLVREHGNTRTRTGLYRDRDLLQAAFKADAVSWYPDE